ncbi:uncharacterized protein MKK02DRAFT_38037 [Dioszegia hungarica]|uniref:Uncharacterized protein n=1 Tax=Dioszegia hungarica TaxID=4972 RepID=A0AA38H6B6_9TREE|nr:uncharacterized protein MKK02DRAFT_38037 [Dioszegia hungarica]KAI9634506.1 hypothetical protein MKK02DRAFT_38037 [Dioszegia hungarica]
MDSLLSYFNSDTSGRDQVFNLNPEGQENMGSLFHKLAHRRTASLRISLAGFAAAGVGRLFEIKGLDVYDREEAKRQAKEQAVQALNQSGRY